MRTSSTSACSHRRSGTSLFDINDFDETLHGPFEFDLKRLAASLVVAGRDRGFDAHDNRHIVHRAIRSYRDRMAGYADDASDRRLLRPAWTRPGSCAYVDKRARAMIEGTVKSTAHHDAVHELPKLTAVVDGAATDRGAPADPREAQGHHPADRRLGADGLSRVPAGGPSRPDRPLPARRLRPQGRRRRERRARSIRRPVHRRRRRRSAVPPGQAGRGIGLRAIPATRAAGRATASGSSRASAVSRPRATSCSAGPSAWAATTPTSASSRTRRAAPSSRR